MKFLLIIFIFLTGSTVFAQDSLPEKGSVKIGKPVKVAKELPIELAYQSELDKEQKMAFYLDGKLVSSYALAGLNPDSIDNVNVIKKDTLIAAKIYDGIIQISSKSPQKLNLVSLIELQNQYIGDLIGDTVFMIDDKIIKEDYEQCHVDANYVLKLVVDKMYLPKSQIEFNIIKIITKTQEHLKEANTVRIK